MSQGQGHETTFAQLVAHELGIGVDEVEVVQGDTDRTPFGLGTYGSRSTPVSGAAAVVAARTVRERARIVAAAMLEAAPADLELPAGVEGHLDAAVVYDPPNLTYPFGAYICLVRVDPGTGEVQVL